MKTFIPTFWQNVLATLVAAALVANVAFLFNASNRLARLEAQVEQLTAGKHFASK